MIPEEGTWLINPAHPDAGRVRVLQEWSISAIVRWEICKLQQLGRIDIDLDKAEVRRVFARVHTWPLSWEVCRQSCSLDIHGDPADELIAATSVVHDIPLVTRDRRLRRSKQVPLAKI